MGRLGSGGGGRRRWPGRVRRNVFFFFPHFDFPGSFCLLMSRRGPGSPRVSVVAFSVSWIFAQVVQKNTDSSREHFYGKFQVQQNSERAKLAKGRPLVVTGVLSSRGREQSLAFTCSYVVRSDVDVIRGPERAARCAAKGCWSGVES